MKNVYAVRYGGNDPRRAAGEVVAVFLSLEDAGKFWDFITRDLGTDKHYWIDEWPVGVPLYPDEDYTPKKSVECEE